MVETGEEVFGYLSIHEAFFGSLEFAPVVVAVWLLAAWFPGTVAYEEGREGEKV